MVAVASRAERKVNFIVVKDGLVMNGEMVWVSEETNVISHLSTGILYDGRVFTQKARLNNQKLYLR